MDALTFVAVITGLMVVTMLGVFAFLRWVEGGDDGDRDPKE